MHLDEDTMGMFDQADIDRILMDRFCYGIKWIYRSAVRRTPRQCPGRCGRAPRRLARIPMHHARSATTSCPTTTRTSWTW